ncbi:hypothetical protein HWX16_20755 [Ochrobactrum intermedium]|uniref:hypothetical protein n=1 Tax=Brucella intermedia TaxID=94625 RepID=UPI00159C30F8|nr:hypothetical protein [Brucella intermedia]NVM42747.1 hypothetical protein [Brucella intermedia]
MARPDFSIEQELLEYLGEDDFFKLVENFAGTRLFVASLKTNKPANIERKVNRKSAEILNRYYGGSYISVPMARSFRAARYRKQGLSNSRIAVKLGMTESGVEHIFRRLKQNSGG